MSWQLLVIISVLTSSLMVIMQRVLLHNDKSDPVAFTVFSKLLGAAVLFVIALSTGFVWPDFSQYWFCILLTFVLYSGGHLLYSYTLKRVEASVFSTLLATSTVWVMIMGYIVFDESIHPEQLLGALLILISVGMLAERSGKLKIDKGILMGLLIGVVFGVASAAWVYVGKHTDVESWNAISAAGPALFILLINPRSIKKMKPFLSGSLLSKMLVLALASGICNLTMLAAYQKGQVSSVAPLMQTSVLVTVVLGVVFLKERTRLWQKSLAAMVCFLGVVLIVLN